MDAQERAAWDDEDAAWGLGRPLRNTRAYWEQERRLETAALFDLLGETWQADVFRWSAEHTQ